MFQNFTATSDPTTAAARIAGLRNVMTHAGLDGFLVPRADAHMGENVAPRDERLAWLTGFTGSAGSCAVLADRAALFVDGRYHLQVRNQCDMAVFTPVPIPDVKPADWLCEQMSAGGSLGFDPWLHGRKEIQELTEVFADKGIKLVPSDNLIDRIWPDRPAPPTGPATIHPLEFAGEDHASKRARIGKALAAAGATSTVLTLPESIAWLLNIRGSDISNTPVAHAFAILRANGSVQLFSNPVKFDAAVQEHLGPDITLAPPEAFGPALDKLTEPVALDEATAPVWVSDRLTKNGLALKWMRDPCTLPKAQKNPVELAGSRAAHLRDGAAMAEFLCWLDQAAPSGNLREIDVVRKLEGFRRATNSLRDISFDTICGAGPDGAIIHYRVTDATNRAVSPGELLLVDSGGQYPDGTTDITRTIAIGAVDPTARHMFTLVLKGMIAVADARFPLGIAGRDLDSFARQALWQRGFDYDHGTGHGVGAFLGVHEGPQNISRRGMEPLLPGMILSNEPGYYREGAFGIRIENLQVVSEASLPKGGDRPMMGFETLTLAPIDRRLIDTGLLSPSECDWLNAYHQRVITSLAPLVTDTTRNWLVAVCAPL